MYSVEGDGAIVTAPPDAPVSLRNVIEITDVTKIGLRGENGRSSGGQSIIGYKVFYAKVTE